MAGRLKHVQRSHKTYGKNTGVFIGFQRTAMKKAEMFKANENRATLFERISSVFNGIRHRKNGEK